jgi:hypothetical protein
MIKKGGDPNISDQAIISCTQRIFGKNPFKTGTGGVECQYGNSGCYTIFCSKERRVRFCDAINGFNF